MSKLWLTVFVCCLTFLVVNADGLADSAADREISLLKKENELLKQRTEKLEKEMAELKKMMMAGAQSGGVSVPAAPAQTVQLTEQDYQKIVEMADQRRDKKSVWSNLDVQLYGFARLDTVYDTAGVVDAGGGSYAKWVGSAAATDSDHLKMTGRVTRFGMNISGPEDNGLKTSGKIEVDFAGSNDTETSNHIRIRQAYVNMDWKDRGFSLLAGQVWDLISPLNPSTLDFGVLWWSGNPGLRRPQLRATQLIDLGNDSSMSLAAAITRNSGGTGDESGANSGTPAVQGRIGYKTDKLAMGVSGHWGREKNKNPATCPVGNYTTWSLNGDLSVPLAEGLSMKGEVFYGQNMGMLACGIGQGVNTSNGNEIQTHGGWLGLQMKPHAKWTLNTGYGIDCVDADDLTGNATTRKQNQTIFGNAVYSLNKNTSVGLEAAYRRTAYQGASDEDALRLQGVFTYKF